MAGSRALRSRTRRIEGPEPAVMTDDAEVAVHEADDMTGLVLGSPNRHTGEALAEEDHSTA